MQGEILSARDVPHDACGAIDAQVEEREEMAAAAASRARFLPSGTADTHERRTRIRHDRANIREIDVDETGKGDDIADAADALAKDVVGEQERILHGQGGVHGAQEAVVGDDIRVSTLRRRRSTASIAWL